MQKLRFWPTVIFTGAIVFILILIAANWSSIVKNDNKSLKIDLNKLAWVYYPFDDIKLKDQALPGGVVAIHEGHYTSENIATKSDIIWYQVNFNLETVPPTNLLLHLERISLADQTYLNGSLLGQTGRFSTSGIEQAADDVPRIYEIPASQLKTGSNALAIRVAISLQEKRGGLWKNRERYIQSSQPFFENFFRRHLPALLIGFVIATVGIYHVFLYLGLRQGLDKLWFGMYAIGIFLYIELRSPLKYLWVSPETNLLFKKFEYLLLYLIPSVFILFLQWFYYQKLKKARWLVTFLICTQLLLGAITIFSDNYSLWVFLMRINHLVILAGMAVVAYLTILEIRQKNSRAWFILYSLLAFFISVAYDVFAAQGYFSDILLAPYGNLALVAGISLFLGRQITRTYVELDFMKTRLESMVSERTERLEKAVNSLESRNRQYQKNMRLAREVQFNLLPHDKKAIQNFEVSSVYMPIEDLGGDFFDFFPINKHRIGILIVDVSGHGLPAAMIAMMVKLAFSASVSAENSPAATMLKVNEIMSTHLSPGDYFTAAYGEIDSEEMHFTYASGGHVPLIYYSSQNSKWRSLHNQGPILGVTGGMAYPETKIDLSPHDKLIFYTDGFTEAINQEQENFGFERLFDFFRKNNQLPMGDAITQLMKTIFSFNEEWTVLDDLTLLGIEIPEKSKKDL